MTATAATTTAASPVDPEMPPAVAAYAAAVVQELTLNSEHAFHDPETCERAARMFHRCKHGSYLGDAHGPDYMCGPCESGDSDEDHALSCAWRHQEIVMREVTGALLRKARRAAADGKPCVITAQEVYGRVMFEDDVVARPVWEWLTPHNLGSLSSLIAHLATPQPDTTR